MREVWRAVKNYEGRYEVSNFGRVKSLYDARHNIYREKILKPYSNGKGYLRVGLFKDGKHKKFLVHVLVAQAFIPNQQNLPCLNHIDENTMNNCVNNLEWCTHEYNNNYGSHKQRIAKSLSKVVAQHDLITGELIKIWPNAYEVEREIGFNKGDICKCCNGKLGQSHGFKWFYIPN